MSIATGNRLSLFPDGFLFPQVVVFTVTIRTGIPETRLAGTGSDPRRSSAL